jgi:hypothetical protein
VKEGKSHNDERRASEKGGEDANQGISGEFAVHCYYIRSNKTMSFIYILVYLYDPHGCQHGPLKSVCDYKQHYLKCSIFKIIIFYTQIGR